MKHLSVIAAIAFSLAGCHSAGELKTIETHSVGVVNIVLSNDSGELRLGKNEFVVQFQNQQGQPVDAGTVQFGSSMAMPGMAPMSGDSEISPAGRTGAYRVKSNFAMSGAWHFTVAWNGPAGQGQTSFNSDVR